MSYSVIDGKLVKHRKWKQWQFDAVGIRNESEDWSKASRESKRRLRKTK